MSKLGGLELNPALGGLEIINQPATSVPQDLATAFGEINEGLLGATYVPIWVVGKQVVNGVNYYVIAKEIRATKDKDTLIVTMVINIPPVQSDGTQEKASVVKIVEEADLPTELELVFKAGTNVCGVSYTPLAYIGKQVVKGINYYFIAQAKVIYPGAEPYAAFVCINVFEGNATLQYVTPITNDLVGYAFTW